MSHLKPHEYPLLSFASIHLRGLARLRTLRVSCVQTPLLCCWLRGEGRLLLNGTWFRLQPGQLYLFAPGCSLEAFSDSDDAAYLVLVMQTLRWSAPADPAARQSAFAEAYRPLVPGLIEVRHPSPLPDKLLKLHQEAQLADAAPFGLQLRMQELLHDIAEEVREASPSSEDAGGIERSVEHIHTGFRDKLKLETLAGIAGFTPTSYSREFKKRMGMSPFEYVNNCRIAYAKQLLAERSGSVKDIAAQSGFASEFYFSRLFKRDVGLPPAVYMKRQLMRVAVASCMRVEDNLRSLGLEAAASVNCHRSKMVRVEEHRRLVSARLEKLRRAQPELIVCDHHHAPYLNELKQIAPTVMFELVADWRAVHARIAEIVGREQDGERNFGQMQALLKQTSGAIRRRFGRESVTVMKLAHKLIRVQGTVRHPLNLLLYDELGLTPGACVPTYDAIVEFAPDRFPEMETEHLFVQHSINPLDDRLLRPIGQRAQWHNTQAVKRGRVYTVPNWVAMSWSPHGRAHILHGLLGEDDASVIGDELALGLLYDLPEKERLP